MRFYYAGFECFWNSFHKIIEAHPDMIDKVKQTNIFLSYYYPSATNSFLSDRKRIGHKGVVVIDSGAHTFFAKKGIVALSNQQAKNSKAPNPYEFASTYLKWAKANYSKLDYFVELDLQELCGYAFVTYQREIAKKLGIYGKMITCYHSCDSFDTYKKLIDDSQSRYIALEGLRLGADNIDYYKLVKYAYDNSCKVHGFAFTRQTLLKQFPFFSVDSSSWKMMARYGSFEHFNGKKLVSVTDKKQMVEISRSINVLPSDRARESEVKKGLFAISEYNKLEELLTEYWKRRDIVWES